MTDKVSIIIRTIGGTNIDKAILSIYSNKYINKEVVIVYQGNDTEYIKYLHNFVKKYPDIEYQIIHNTDISCDQRAKNLNLGLKKATGRYICFLDDDDEFYPNHLESLILAMNTENKAWAIGNVVKKIIDNNGRTIRLQNMKKITNSSLYTIYYRNPIAIHSYIFDKNFCNTLAFRENMILLEDYAFILDTFIKYNLKPAIINKFISVYTIRAIKKKSFKTSLKAYEDIVLTLRQVLNKKWCLAIFFWKIKILLLKSVASYI